MAEWLDPDAGGVDGQNTVLLGGEMRPFVVALFAAVFSMGPFTTATVDHQTVTVHVAFTASASNLGVEVAMTALETVPADWAEATVFHHWIIDDPTLASFDDEWARMPAGRYQIQATLWTDGGSVRGLPFIVEVKN